MCQTSNIIWHYGEAETNGKVKDQGSDVWKDDTVLLERSFKLY